MSQSESEHGMWVARYEVFDHPLPFEWSFSWERPWVNCTNPRCPAWKEHEEGVVHQHPGGIADALVEIEGDQA